MATDPARVEGLPPDVIRALTLRCAAVLTALASIPASAAPAAVTKEPDEWISEQDVVTRFGLDAPWLKRHRPLLKARRILSCPSRKRSLYHARRLARYLEDRAGNP